MPSEAFSMADNIILKGGIYHVRMAIPEDIQKAFGNRKILSHSLGTGLRSEAMKLRLKWLSQWKSEIDDARAKKANRGDAWKEDAANFATQVETMGEQQLMTAGGYRKPDQRLSSQEVTDNTADAIKSFAALGESGKIPKEQVLSALKLILNQIKLAQEHQGKKIPLSAMLPVIEENKEHIRNIIRTNITQEAELGQKEIIELESIIQTPTNYKPKSPITDKLLKDFRKFRENREILIKTIDTQESKLLKISKYLASTGKVLNFDTIAQYVETLSHSKKTINQYLMTGSVFWKWAMKYDPQWRKYYKEQANPFDGHEIDKIQDKALTSSTRKAFNPEEVQEIYLAAKKKNLTTLAHLIQIAAHTGARIEEICQLKLNNIIKIEGILSFDIVDSKTKAGIRTIPIHSKLIPLVESLQTSSTDDYLLEIHSKNMYGIRSDALSKAFGKLKTSLDFGPQHVFHSIRKTVITQLHRAGVTGPIIAELVGHETGTVTYDVYSEGASAQQKLSAIENLKYT